MIPHWTTLNQESLSAYRAAIAFLRGRLEEKQTIDWALKLKRSEEVKRLAILDLLNSLDGRKLKQPWHDAWALIEESWREQVVRDHPAVDTLQIRSRLHAGDRSGALIATIVDLVAPRLKVEPFSTLQTHFRKAPKRPRSFDDLFSVGLSSAEQLNPTEFGLGQVNETSFLLSLLNAVDAVLLRAMDIGKRIGWDGKGQFWRLGELYRVYYVGPNNRPEGEHEPDEFHEGIAPAVKLLHAVVVRLAEIDIAAAVRVNERWRLLGSPIHTRLWAAIARNPQITSSEAVGSTILDLDSTCFWDLHGFPELAELRAVRFNDLDLQAKRTITRRIRKLPPRTNWPRAENSERVDEFRLYWALRELKRIQIAGGILPEDDLNWLQGRIDRFPELAGMSRVDEGFMGTLEARFVPPNPDRRFDKILGVERLAALEADLKSSRRAWDDDPAERAGDWIQDRTNAATLLPDLEAATDAGAAYPRVWERFGWGHVPSERDDDQLRQETQRVLLLLRQLPLEAARFAIDGISNWLSVWRKLVVDSIDGFVVWHRLWPIAVAATNEHTPSPAAEESSSLPAKASSDLDTLNTPVGKLLDVFLTACPGLNVRPDPFADSDEPRLMRDIAIAAPGHSGLIVRHRMIESLPYFLNADAQWARDYLIEPLITDSVDALALWRAIARRTQFTDVLRIIGGAMAERALDLRLSRDTRRHLVFSLVVECLHALREIRPPAVPYPRIQQMLRMIDDEVRAHAADTVARFIRDLSAPQRVGQASFPREELFRRAVVPFLKEVWPQERSLVTQGVSRAFADLPAAVGECFGDAVELVERFLVPFDCWSMFEYGFHAGENRTPLSSINNVAKGEALLRLLNVTIGTSEGAVIPHDLAEALTQIEGAVPKAVSNPVFRRLATLARRS